MAPAPVLEASGLRKYFPARGAGRGLVHAVDGVDFALAHGETLGLVGESGCGKTTVGRLLLKLIEPTAGSVRLEGTDITALDRGEMRRLRARIQIVFQDPFSALNPRHRVGDILAAPFAIHGTVPRRERRGRVAALLEQVGLSADQADKYPHEFSGGQRQRIGIARAIALNPAVIVCDEPVSALDVSVQAQVINLLRDLQDALGVAFLFISHDLAVVEQISHRVAVMYLGQIVELAACDLIFSKPFHPYTEALMKAIPVPDPVAARGRKPPIRGEVPSAVNPPSGCRFHTRCPLADGECRTVAPKLTPRRGGRLVACHKR